MLLFKQILWRFPLVALGFLIAMPILVIVFSWHTAQVDVWQHLIETGLARLLKNTFVLMLGVGLVVTLLGVSLAWLTAVCEFPGRSWLDWALLLPLAIPTYVVAFIAVGLLSYSGPVMTYWRELFGAEAWYPDVRQPAGVVLVMASVLYPYVYMLARSAFLQQGKSLIDAARTLGVSPLRSFFSVALPMARPAIVAGLALALMETLADFGAVSVFNYDTFTTAIYKSWFGFFNLQAAAQLASLLLLFVCVALMLERKARSGKAAQFNVDIKQERIRLVGVYRWLASAFCFAVFLLAFVVPVGQLIVWLFKANAQLDERFFALIRNTFLLGCIAAFAVVGFALVTGASLRFGPSRIWQKIVQLYSLGYALPGSVLAVGIMIGFTKVDHWLWSVLGGGKVAQQFLVGTLFALIVAYVIRYFSVGYSPVQSGLESIKPVFQEVAQSLGLARGTILVRVYFPMLFPGIFTALILVLIDVMKEMPATLLLRPFGWDTLAVRVYEMTSEGEWQRAALPALTLVLISFIPVVMIVRRSRY